MYLLLNSNCCVTWTIVPSFKIEWIRNEQSTSRASIGRAVFVDVNYGALDPLIERVFVLSFRNSIKKTAAGLIEKLEER